MLVLKLKDSSIKLSINFELPQIKNIRFKAIQFKLLQPEKSQNISSHLITDKKNFLCGLPYYSSLIEKPFIDALTD